MAAVEVPFEYEKRSGAIWLENEELVLEFRKAKLFGEDEVERHSAPIERVSKMIFDKGLLGDTISFSVPPGEDFLKGIAPASKNGRDIELRTSKSDREAAESLTRTVNLGRMSDDIDEMLDFTDLTTDPLAEAKKRMEEGGN